MNLNFFLVVHTLIETTREQRKNELSRFVVVFYVKLGLRLKSTLFTSSSLGIPESKLGFKKHTCTDQLDFFSYKNVDDTNIVK